MGAAMAGERRGRAEGRNWEGTAAEEGERSAAAAVAVAGEEVGFCVAAKLVGEQGPERARAWQIPEFPLVAHSLSPCLPFLIASFSQTQTIQLFLR